MSGGRTLVELPIAHLLEVAHQDNLPRCVTSISKGERKYARFKFPRIVGHKRENRIKTKDCDKRCGAQEIQLNEP